MAVDRRRAQARLGVTQDGIFGPQSWGALVAYAADRPGAAVCLLRGRALAAQEDVQDPLRAVDFLANVTHETGNFTRLREIMTYSSAERIRETWPTRFPTVASARPYVRQPVLLANKVYDRPREGNTQPGDGWRFRGGGDIQTTFRNGYARASLDVGQDLVAEPDLITDPGTSILTALGFYRRNNLWAYVDRGQNQQCRGVLNTGSPSTPRSRIIGIDDVDRRRTRLLALFN